MRYVKQRDKRLCVRTRVTDVAFFSLVIAKYRKIEASTAARNIALHLKLKLEVIVTESCPGSPRPVLRVFGRFAPQYAPELNS